MSQAINILMEELAAQYAGMRRAHNEFRYAILHHDPNEYYDNANINIKRRMVQWYISNIKLLRRLVQRIEGTR